MAFNMPDHLLWQTSENTLGSKGARVLNMAWLYMQGLYRVVNMSQYAWICLNILNKPDHYWIWLNVPEYAWKCLSKLFSDNVRFSIILHIWQGFEYATSIKYIRVMPWYSYNNIIIIVNNVITLEFLPVRLVHPANP